MQAAEENYSVNHPIYLYPQEEKTLNSRKIRTRCRRKRQEMCSNRKELIETKILKEELEAIVQEISQKVELKTRDVNARGKRK